MSNVKNVKCQLSKMSKHVKWQIPDVKNVKCQMPNVKNAKNVKCEATQSKSLQAKRNT